MNTVMLPEDKSQKNGGGGNLTDLTLNDLELNFSSSLLVKSDDPAAVTIYYFLVFNML